MFFTKEDYTKIQQWLQVNSIKDLEFNEASVPFKGNEFITLVQDGKNVRVDLKDFVNQLITLLDTPDFINVTEKYKERYISLSRAMQLIPPRDRKTGQVITFLDEYHEWQIYQFQGECKNQWCTASCWVNLIQSFISGSKVTADEEDLTIVTDDSGQEVIKFKDKVYNEDEFSGLGRVFLRKNLVSVTGSRNKETTINLLINSMFAYENTVYIIQYDYDLNGQTITIPEGCTLIFSGGSLNNGTIAFDGNKLSSITGNGTLKNIILNNTSFLYISGNIKKESVTINSVHSIADDIINIFDFVTDFTIHTFDFGDTIDIADALQAAIDYSMNFDLSENSTNIYTSFRPKIIVPSGRYIVTHKIDIPNEVRIDFNSSTIIPYSETDDLSAFLDDDTDKYCVFRIGNYYYYGYNSVSGLLAVGWFGNLYCTNPFGYDISCIRISNYMSLERLMINGYKGSILYNSERNKYYTDSGYCDNRWIKNINIISSLSEDDGYDVEIYWGDETHISHISGGRWLIKNTDGTLIEDTISPSLYIENSHVIINNHYCTHAVMRILNSNVQINKGRFIQNTYAEQSNYNLIEVKTEFTSDNRMLSALELNSCVFMGRFLNSYNVDSSIDYYDIYRDQLSKVTLTNTYHKSSDFGFDVFNTMTFYPYSNIIFETKDVNRVYTDFTFTGDVNDGMTRYIGSTGINTVKYFKIYALLDKDRFIGKEIDAVVDFSGSQGICHFICNYTTYAGNYLAVYVGDTEDTYNQYVIIPVYGLNLSDYGTFRFFYNGYSIDNTYRMTDCEDTAFPTVCSSLNCIWRDENIIATVTDLPMSGTWKNGDIIIDSSDSDRVYEYYNGWILKFAVTTDYESIDLNYVGRGSVVYDSTLCKVLYFLGYDNGNPVYMDSFGSLPCPKYVENISELEGNSYQAAPLVWDSTQKKPFWELGGAWYDANSYRAGERNSDGTLTSKVIIV